MLKETAYEKDKNSKLLTITKKGKKALTESRLAIDWVAQDIYKSIPEDDMLLCIQFVSPTQKLNAQKWLQLKGFEIQLPG